MRCAPLRQHVLKFADIFGIAIAAAVDIQLKCQAVKYGYGKDKQQSPAPRVSSVDGYGMCNSLIYHFTPGPKGLTAAQHDRNARRQVDAVPCRDRRDRHAVCERQRDNQRLDAG